MLGYPVSHHAHKTFLAVADTHSHSHTHTHPLSLILSVAQQLGVCQYLCPSVTFRLLCLLKILPFSLSVRLIAHMSTWKLTLSTLVFSPAGTHLTVLTNSPQSQSETFINTTHTVGGLHKAEVSD